MNGFLELSDSELVTVDGGGALLVAAFAVGVIGITVGVGVLVYKSADGMVGAIQQKQSSGGTASE
jgi:lactobin A/cerein 7B family class IIb bacteriocin